MNNVLIKKELLLILTIALLLGFATILTNMIGIKISAPHLNNSWIAFVIPLISLSGMASLIANLFNTRYTFSLPVATSLVIIILTIGSTLNILYNITGIIIFIGLLGQIYSLYAFPNFRQKLLQYKIELLILLILGVLYCIFLANSGLLLWDDQAFWGIFAKELKHYNVIYPPKGTLSSILPTHVHYTRGASIFYYFSLYFSEYNEILVLRSNFVLHMIFLTPLMANKHWWQTIGLVSLMLIIPTTQFALYSVYLDGLLALVFSSILLISVLEDNKYKLIILITPILLSIQLFKELGFWLGLLAALIVFYTKFVGNDQKQHINIKTNLLILIGLLSLPVITRYFWFEYVKTYLPTYNPNTSQIISLIQEIINEDGLKRYGFFACLRGIKTILTNFNTILLFAVNLITWFLIHRYAPKYEQKFNRFLFITVIGYILFYIFRIYLWLTVLEGSVIYMDDSFLHAQLLRYSISYFAVYIAVPCAYTKKILFDEYKIKTNVISNIVSVITILVSLYTFIYVVKYLHSHLPLAKHYSNRVAILQNTSLIRELYAKGFDIEYDFSYRKINNSDSVAHTEKIAACYLRAYYLSPYYNNNIQYSCLSFKQTGKDYTDIAKFNTINSNIDTNLILQNPSLYKGKCHIKYYMVYNYVDITCEQ